jgi:hypothetical protein
MRAETVDQIAEESTGSVAIRFRNFHGLKLHQSVPGSDPALELRFQRIQFFSFLVPHEFHVTDRAGIVKKKEEVLEEFQIFAELPPQSFTKDSMLLFHVEGLPGRGDCITDMEQDTSLKQNQLSLK